MQGRRKWGFKKIYLNIFSPPYFWGDDISKYIFTTVFWGKKIYLNIFSPPYFRGRNIYLNIFFPDHYRKRENIFQAMAGCLAHFPIGMGSYRYINIAKLRAIYL